MRTRFLFLVSSCLVACRAAPVVAPPPRVAPITCVASVETGATVEAMRGPKRPSGHVADDDEEDMLRPCDPKGDEAKAAEAAIDGIAERIAGLSPTASPKPVVEELTALLETQCFQLATADPRHDLAFDSALALRTWWDAGGSEWLEHWVHLGEARRVVVPPTPRRTLTAERAPKHPLAPLLCSASAAACGHETAGWAKRADTALERRADVRKGQTEEECVAEAKKEDAVERYGALQQCLEQAAPTRTALPLGSFKAPADGWLIVTGGPSSHRCKTIRAYDLATGAAYASSDCNGTPKVEVGRVPLAAIREAAWMLALARAAEHDVRTAAVSFGVPAEIAIERPAGSHRGFGFTGGCGTGGWLRAFSWMRERKGALEGQVSGQIRWPAGCNDAEQHAAELLAIAEAGFEEGCAPTPPPSNVAWSAPGPTLAQGIAPSLDDPSLSGARGALATARSPKGACPKLP